LVSQLSHVDIDSHVSSLNARIRELESQSRSVAPETRMEQGEVNNVPSSVSPSTRSIQSIDHRDHRSPIRSGPSVQPHTNPRKLAPDDREITSLPSNAQLISHISTSHELPWISGDRTAGGDTEGRASIDLSTLPPDEEVEALIDHHIRYTNSAFPVLHDPTFRKQASKVRLGVELCTSADVCMLYRRCFGPQRILCSIHSRARCSLHFATRIVTTLHETQTSVP
jgi:hypothetical protein